MKLITRLEQYNYLLFRRNCLQNRIEREQRITKESMVELEKVLAMIKLEEAAS